MRLENVEQAIELCKEHLDRSEGRNTLFELYITRYLQVMICASYEQEVKRIILEKVKRVRRIYIQELAKAYIESKSLVRSIKTSEIADALGRFGKSYKEKFQRKLKRTVEVQRAETYFNNIVTERHLTAHNPSGSDMTFGELVQAYNESNCILDILKEVLLGAGTT